MAKQNTVLIVDYHSMGFADSLVASWHISMKEGPLDELYFLTHSGVADREFVRTLLGRVRFPKKPYAENPGGGRYLLELIQSITDVPSRRVLVLSKHVQKFSQFAHEIVRSERKVEWFHPEDWVDKDSRNEVISELAELTTHLETLGWGWYKDHDFIERTIHLIGHYALGVDSIYELEERLPHLIEAEDGGMRGGVVMRVSPQVFYA